MRLADLFLVASSVLAQNPSGAISGLITDPENQRIAGVEVQLRRAGEVEPAVTRTSARGEYSFTGLTGGTYELLIPHVGFTYEKLERKAIALTPTQTLRLDLKLEFAGNLGTIGDDDATILRANRPPAPTGPAPRMPDGKPDLSGLWNGNNDSNPEQASVLPWAETIAKSRLERDNPSTLCLPADILLKDPNPFEIVQTNKQILIVGEYNGALREIFMDGRPHPGDPNPTWMGHSIGRWDGDTLVVDTIGFNEKSWLDLYPHTEKLHVVTRYRRTDFGHMDVRIAAEDPGTFTKPWNIHIVWDLLPGEELQEYICNENNKDPLHMDKK